MNSRFPWMAWTLSALSLGTLPADAQSLSWVRQLGSNDIDKPASATADGSGGVYLSGYTLGSFGGPNNGGYDAWLAHYDSVGNLGWVRQLGTIGDDRARGAAPDTAGGLFVVGETQASLGGPSAGSIDAWLARYDPAGNQLWIRQLGTITADWAYSAAPDGSGGVYVAGDTFGHLGGTNPNPGFTDAWLARYDGAGNQLWIRQLGSTHIDHVRAAATDEAGGVHVCGTTQGSLGGPNAGSEDGWLARYDGGGNLLWTRQLGTASLDALDAAASDGAGGVYVGGRTAGDLGGPNAGPYDAWLARFDASGSPLWIRQLGTDQWDDVLGAAPDGLGGVTVCGSTSGELGAPINAGGDAWLARYDANGNQSWIQQIVVNQYDAAYAVTLDGAGGVYVGGYTEGVIAQGGAGYNDAWVALYDTCSPVSYCVSTPNSTGQPAIIGVQGETSISANGMALTVSACPPGQIGLFFIGNSKTQISFGDGYLCVTGALQRLYPAVILNGAGAGNHPIDFTDPSSPASMIQPGDTRNFQFWYRDPPVGSGFNLSDGLSAFFCP